MTISYSPTESQNPSQKYKLNLLFVICELLLILILFFSISFNNSKEVLQAQVFNYSFSSSLFDILLFHFLFSLIQLVFYFFCLRIFVRSISSLFSSSSSGPEEVEFTLLTSPSSSSSSSPLEDSEQSLEENQQGSQDNVEQTLFLSQKTLKILKFCRIFLLVVALGLALFSVIKFVFFVKENGYFHSISDSDQEIDRSLVFETMKENASDLPETTTTSSSSGDSQEEVDYGIDIVGIVFLISSLILSLGAFYLLTHSLQEIVDSESDNEKSDFVRLLYLADQEWYLLAGGFVALLVSSSATLAAPVYFGKVVQVVGDQGSVDELNKNMIPMTLIFFIGGISAAVRAYLFGVAGERFVSRLRKDLFKQISIQEIGFFDVNRTGELISRLSSDTQVVQNAATVNLSMGIRTIFQVTGSFLLLLITNWLLSLIMLSIVPIILACGIFYGRRLKAISKQYQEELAKATTIAEEVFSNIRTVRSFSKEARAQENYNQEIEESFNLGKKRTTASSVFIGIGTSAVLFSLGLVAYVGARQVLDGTTTVGSLTSFLLYTISLAANVGFLSGLYGDYASAVGASSRIFHLLDRKPNVPPSASRTPDSVSGNLSLNNVCFAYPSRVDSQVLSSVSINLKSGNILALVGPSGGGKSTIVSLIERFYFPSQGVITLDGIPIDELDASWYRSNIGLVSQEPSLFACSIADNITYGLDRQVSQDEIITAAQKANAHNFITQFPEQYETIVGERGIRLSGGQKQRIAIARALLLNPKILLLDEATSALDAESEHLVQTAIDTLMQNRTVLVIAHRLSTVRNASEVIVVDGGRIVQKGSHENLLQDTDGLYYQLVKRQLLQDA